MGIALLIVIFCCILLKLATVAKGSIFNKRRRNTVERDNHINANIITSSENNIPNKDHPDPPTDV